VHLGLNIVNDLADDASGADAANVNPTPFSGGSRVIQYGLVSRRRMLELSIGFYAVAAAIGLYLAATRTWALLVVGVVGFVLSVEYTAPPLKFVHRGLGEPVTAVGFGPLMAVGTYLACARHWSWEAFYISLPVGLLVALILYVNQVPDRIADGKVGKRTLIVRWPKAQAVAAYQATVLAAYLLICIGVLAGITPAWTLLGLLSAPLALRTLRGLREHYDSPYQLMPAMGTNIALHLATGLLLLLGYAIDLVIR
jgi:1,4-dihydroxy-2-naphthoate octaprenyltransferase